MAVWQVVRDLHAEGHRVVIVSSGAVGVGAQRLGLAQRPKDLPKKQALAAVGQVHLMRFYEDFFSALGLVGPVPPLRAAEALEQGVPHASTTQPCVYRAVTVVGGEGMGEWLWKDRARLCTCG